jgi:hypothetical protein
VSTSPSWNERSVTCAALNHRVSTVDQNPDAARYGFAVALDIEETGSDVNNQRPGLVQVL